MPRPVTSVFCPAGRWTQVEWYLGTIFLSKVYISDPSVRIQWRWFSGGLPPYWQGSFVGRARITLTPAIYLSLEFNPDRDTTITFAP